MYKPSEIGLFICKACCSQTNATCYNCEPCELSICVKCTSASMITSVKHNAHKKHLLTQFQSSNYIDCMLCGFQRGSFRFACKDCHFYLCYNCALLPPTTTQRWDKDPFILICPPYFEHPEEFYFVLCSVNKKSIQIIGCITTVNATIHCFLCVFPKMGGSDM